MPDYETMSAGWSAGDLDLIVSTLSQSHMSFWAGAGIERNFAIRLWSPGAERIYGYSRSQAIGHSYIDLFVNPRERERAIQDHARIVETGEVYDWDWAADDVTASGEVRTMLTHCFRVRDPADGTWLLAELGVDISDFNRASQQLRKVREDEFKREEMTLARAIGQIGQSVAEMGRDGTIDLVGKSVLAAARDAIRGVSRGVVVLDGESGPVTLEDEPSRGTPEFAFDFDAAYNEAIRKRGSVFEDGSDSRSVGSRLAVPGGRGRRTSFAVLALQGIPTRPVGVIALALSTGRKWSAREVERLETITAFAGPLISVAQELDHIREEESRRVLAQQKQVIFRSVLHTVGNEVYTLHGFTDQLEEVANRFEVPQEVQLLIGQIRDQSDRLDSALLDLSNELDTADRKEPVSVADVVGSIINPLRGRYPGIEFLISVPQGHAVLIVESWLHHILYNVVSNAVQVLEATDGGGEIRVSSCLAVDDFITIDIEDSGPGVPSDIVDTLFDKGVSRRTGGTGRGLHIARDLARSGDGELALYPAGALSGAQFRLTLPQAPAGSR